MGRVGFYEVRHDSCKWDARELSMSTRDSTPSFTLENLRIQHMQVHELRAFADRMSKTLSDVRTLGHRDCENLSLLIFDASSIRDGFAI
jgi:hypothetical protein